ncbi:TIGR02679 family protein [Streptomyces sp. SID3343]|uniref:TIGR02679 family protein n=1 Tax=Streptomyces sp. SID3343 TaxID=2690260 RepID=UPI0031F9530C
MSAHPPDGAPAATPSPRERAPDPAVHPNAPASAPQPDAPAPAPQPDAPPSRTVSPDTLAWLARPELAGLWQRLRARLERNGRAVRGHLRSAHWDQAERRELAMLLGKSVPPTGNVTVSLADVDARLRAGTGGLVAALEALGDPVRDRQGERRSAHDTTTRLWDEAAVIADHDWVDSVRRSGALARLDADTALRLIEQGARVLTTIDPDHPVGRGDLAARVTGTAHGLDDGTLLARIVLRGLAREHTGGVLPTNARARRDLWRAAGATTDEVSATVLTLGLRPPGSTPAARMLRERADAGFETHLTIREIRRLAGPPVAPGTTVHVCENPRVVELAADRGARTPLVCTAGNPATVVTTLLGALAEAGADLRYHGDFDWPGLAMADRILSRFGAHAWRMTAADYEEGVTAAATEGVPLEPLTGRPHEASWDSELTATMLALRVKLEEESVLASLALDLT